MDTGINLNKQTYYEQSGEQKEAQDIVNSVLEKEKQRKEVIIKLTKKDLLNYGISIERINNSKFGVLKNISINIYPDGEGNIYKYSKENGVEFINSISGLENDDDLKFAEQESGYKLKKGKLYKDGKEILQILPNGNVNPEYIKGVDNINFFEDLHFVFGMKKAILNGKKIEYFPIKYFKKTIISGVSRIKEVLFFRQHGYIPNDKDFQELLIRAIQELPNQSADTRFYENAKGERMGMEVKKQELDEYLHPTEGDPLITQEMYNRCIKLIERRDELIKKKKETKEKTKSELEIEKTKKGVLDRIKDLLGW